MRFAMLGLLGLMSAGAVMTAGASPAAAFDYPYCLQGQEWGMPGECSYPSYEACQAAASGRGLSCNINPRVAFQQPPQPDPRRYGRRHPDYNY
jgi:Protein of unknown function (DUF3551)